jgi:hypothetical protein
MTPLDKLRAEVEEIMEFHTTADPELRWDCTCDWSALSDGPCQIRSLANRLRKAAEWIDRNRGCDGRCLYETDLAADRILAELAGEEL